MPSLNTSYAEGSPRNAHEALARLEKAVKLADIMQAAGIGADLAREMDSHDWTVAAGKAGVRPPGLKTIQLTIQTLARRTTV